MVAVPEAVTVLDVVTGLAAPVAYLAIVLAPSVYGAIADSYLSSLSSLAFEIRGLVHVAIDMTAYTGDGISGGELFRAAIHR